MGISVLMGGNCVGADFTRIAAPADSGHAAAELGIPPGRLCTRQQLESLKPCAPEIAV